MKKKDFLWFLLFPVYLTSGTIRHEGSHAFAAMPKGPPEFTKMDPNLAAGLMETLSRDEDGSVRRKAAKGLPEFTKVNPDLAAGLMETLSRNKDWSVREAVAEGLREFTEMYPQRALRLVEELKKGRGKTLRFRKRLSG